MNYAKIGHAFLKGLPSLFLTLLLGSLTILSFLKLKENINNDPNDPAAMVQ